MVAAEVVLEPSQGEGDEVTTVIMMMMGHHATAMLLTVGGDEIGGVHSGPQTQMCCGRWRSRGAGMLKKRKEEGRK